ncbi:GGDEF domain-containing protein [Streptomyces albus]|uniref:GGDEF domain-containing protein n=1 Tax=Streptomyces albus TaxID=1888 RepID=UPI0033C748BF
MDLHPFAAVTGPALVWAVHTGWLSRRLAAARRDPLTGLLTRAGWTARAERLLRRHPGTATVLLIDLDGFKGINDTHGHAAGDLALTAAAERLAAWSSRQGLAGRLGGDEFVALVHDTDDNRLADLHRALHEPVLYLGTPLPLAASIGVCHVADLDRPVLADALAVADAHMYEIKGRHRR